MGAAAAFVSVSNVARLVIKKILLRMATNKPGAEESKELYFYSIIRHVVNGPAGESRRVE
jgi:hypothetical protein